MKMKVFFFFFLFHEKTTRCFNVEQCDYLDDLDSKMLFFLCACRVIITQWHTTLPYHTIPYAYHTGNGIPGIYEYEEAGMGKAYYIYSQAESLTLTLVSSGSMQDNETFFTSIQKSTFRENVVVAKKL